MAIFLGYGVRDSGEALNKLELSRRPDSILLEHIQLGHLHHQEVSHEKILQPEQYLH
jgi:hypothetical protein